MFLQLKRPFRYHDWLHIGLSRFGSLSTDSIKCRTEFVGTTSLWKDETPFTDWTANVYKNILNTETKEKEMSGYEVDCDYYGGGIRVYGIHTEADARVTGNNKYMAISISGLTNPPEAYTESANSVSVAHYRWSYSGGPMFLVHYNPSESFESD